MTDLTARFEELLAPVITYDTDVEIVGGDGVWVTDSEGPPVSRLRLRDLGHEPRPPASARQGCGTRPGGSALARRRRLQVLVEGAGCRAPPRGDPGRHRAVPVSQLRRRSRRGCRQACPQDDRPPGNHGLPGWLPRRTMGSVSYTTSKAKYRQGYHPILPSVFVTPFPHPFAWGMSQEDADRTGARRAPSHVPPRHHCPRRSPRSWSSRSRARVATTRRPPSS